MRRIKQRYGDDCGIACVAMVAGVPYAQAAEKFSLKPNGSRLTNTKDLITALRLLGVSVEGDHLEPLPKQSYRWRAALREDECVAILKSPTRKNGKWHWRVYDPVRDRVVDPKDRPYQRLRATSRLRIRSA
tara:strand:+ start:48980 stop:49372 length:393 start_codon:yes stop_codon:yes gene_type:complete